MWSRRPVLWRAVDADMRWQVLLICHVVAPLRMIVRDMELNAHRVHGLVPVCRAALCRIGLA